MRPFNVIGYNLANLFNFKGRARRSHFWPYVAAVVVASLVAMCAIMASVLSAGAARIRQFAAQNPEQATVDPAGHLVTVERDLPEWPIDFSLMFGLMFAFFALVIFSLAAAVVRRLHDRNVPGPWGLLPLPFIVFASIAMLVLVGQLESGAPNVGLFVALMINNLCYFFALGALIVLLCCRSTKGDNRYGPEPAR